MTQIHVIKTANHLLQYCVTISWWNCFANDLLKLQALKIRILYSFVHYQHKNWAWLYLNPKKKFNNKSGLVTIPSLYSPPPPYMSWMEKGEKKKVWFTSVNLKQKQFGNYNEGAVMHWKSLHHPRQFREHSWVTEHNMPFKQTKTKRKSKQSKAGKCFPSNKTVVQGEEMKFSTWQNLIQMG